jgi:hypothetical protein
LKHTVATVGTEVMLAHTIKKVGIKAVGTLITMGTEAIL